jgi:hypothetical protein
LHPNKELIKGPCHTHEEQGHFYKIFINTFCFQMKQIV